MGVMNAEQLVAEALSLPVEERVEIAAKILASLSRSPPALGSAHSTIARRAGSAAGRVRMADDFDAPLDDFAEYS